MDLLDAIRPDSNYDQPASGGMFASSLDYAPAPPPGTEQDGLITL